MFTQDVEANKNGNKGEAGVIHCSSSEQKIIVEEEVTKQKNQVGW